MSGVALSLSSMADKIKAGKLKEGEMATKILNERLEVNYLVLVR